MSRNCASCRRSLGRDSFSKNQWSKPIGVSRCSGCVHGGGGGGGAQSGRPQTARRNESNDATYTAHALAYPFAEGTFRHVAKGEYTSGLRRGQQSVCKWFKTGAVFEDEFFRTDILAVEKTLHLVEEWNAARIIDKHVKVNIPAVWSFVSGVRAGQKVLSEPFIDNYQKFNSNSGWADNATPWPRVMQALSHYTYHVSGGQFVLCDLQGGVYADGIVLTDPAVLSRRKEYGVTDLGATGISTFFSQHRCNEFCQSHWQKPADRNAYHQVRQGTSMVASSGGGGGGGAQPPTQHSRLPMSGYAAYAGYGMGPQLGTVYDEGSDDDYY